MTNSISNIRKGNSIKGGDNSENGATAKVRKLNPIDAEYGDIDNDF